MITNPQSLPTHPFKPYPIRLTWVGKSNKDKKRCYKHIHHLNIIYVNKPHLQRKLMPKTLHSVCINAWLPGENQNLPIAIMKKIVKPYRKYLTNLQGNANHPQIQKLLPHLTDLKVTLAKESLQMLSSHSNFKKLRFDVVSDRSAKMNGEKLLMKYKNPLSKTLAKIKDLTTLSMRIAREDQQAAWLLLEIIGQNAHLDSLNEFSLNLVEGTYPVGLQKLQEKASKAKVLAKLTHFSSDSKAWYYSVISSGKLDNLSVLRLKFASTEISSDTKDILQFHSLPKLNKFTLSFKADSFPSERDFFENFTLPSSLEDFNLTLTGFTLSDSQFNNQFFNRLQEAKGVKALEFTIAENQKNVAFTAQFACLLIKCFDRLETLKYRNPKEFFSSLFGKKDNSLDFQEFWTAVGNSKETIHSVSLSVPEINFSKGAKTLGTGFPMLQKLELELEDSASSAAELGRFCRKVSSLREITLKGVKFQDEGRLGVFLDDMREIPKGGNFTLHLDVEKIKQKSLIACLKKYIKDVQMKGRLGIQFKLTRTHDKQPLREILRLVVQKGCFDLFKIVEGFNTLFSVVKADTIEKHYSLNLN